MKVDVLLGMQWGDEGKGKIVDVLTPQYDIIAALVAHLVPGGFFVLSHPEQPEPPVFNYLKLVSDKKYAAAHIKIYVKI